MLGLNKCEQLCSEMTWLASWLVRGKTVAGRRRFSAAGSDERTKCCHATAGETDAGTIPGVHFDQQPTKHDKSAIRMASVQSTHRHPGRPACWRPGAAAPLGGVCLAAGRQPGGMWGAGSRACMRAVSACAHCHVPSPASWCARTGGNTQCLFVESPAHIDTCANNQDSLAQLSQHTKP